MTYLISIDNIFLTPSPIPFDGDFEIQLTVSATGDEGIRDTRVRAEITDSDMKFSVWARIHTGDTKLIKFSSTFSGESGTRQLLVSVEFSVTQVILDSQFFTFTVEEKLGAILSIDGVAASPSSILSGERYNIIATITNIGAASASFIRTQILDGSSSVTSSSTSYRAGETKNIVFSLRRKNTVLGTHTFTVVVDPLNRVGASLTQNVSITVTEPFENFVPDAPSGSDDTFDPDDLPPPEEDEESPLPLEELQISTLFKDEQSIVLYREQRGSEFSSDLIETTIEARRVAEQISWRTNNVNTFSFSTVFNPELFPGQTIEVLSSKNNVYLYGLIVSVGHVFNENGSVSTQVTGMQADYIFRSLLATVRFDEALDERQRV